MLYTLHNLVKLLVLLYSLGPIAGNAQAIPLRAHPKFGLQQHFTPNNNRGQQLQTYHWEVAQGRPLRRRLSAQSAPWTSHRQRWALNYKLQRSQARSLGWLGKRSNYPNWGTRRQ